MDAAELSGWQVLMQVQHEEREQEAEHAKHVADSGDGEVHYHGRRPDDDEGEDEITDGAAE